MLTAMLCCFLTRGLTLPDGIPVPVRAIEQPLRVTVVDVVRGGTSSSSAQVVGHIESGFVGVGDKVRCVDHDHLWRCPINLLCMGGGGGGPACLVRYGTGVRSSRARVVR
jgi:hypothetical protein